MDDTQRIVKCGNLSLHSQGGFFKKRWHSKYLVLYDGSKSGVKRLELFDSEIKFKKQNPAKIIPLVDCVRVVTCQRNKTTYTFEVRTSDQFYLLAGQSFQDMNDWVNCLRLVAFGSQQSQQQPIHTEPSQQQQQSQATTAHQVASGQRKQVAASMNQQSSNSKRGIDVLLETKRNLHTPTGSHRGGSDYARPLDKITGSGGGSNQQQLQQAPLVPTETHPALAGCANSQRVTTASQAAAAAASALARTRQRQPSLLGSCKPQPPTDSPFIKQQQQQQLEQATGASGSSSSAALLASCDPLADMGGQLDTLTPTVRGRLIAGALKTPTMVSGTVAAVASSGPQQQQQQQRPSAGMSKAPLIIQATLDEEEENMLYCSIEDNPSEHNYRVKVIETELSLRCQLKCYQLTASTTINQQYEQLGQFNSTNKTILGNRFNEHTQQPMPQVTFYQLIIGPQELTLLNDYAALTLKQQQQQQATSQQQGLWSWPYQCIRRYGFDKDNCFMFEAGRKCTSGPGQFIVQTPKAYSIYQDVVKFVNELRSLSTVELGDGLLPAGGSSGGKVPTTVCGEFNNSQTKSATAAAAAAGSRQQVVVTQIPVTWTPSTTGAIKVDTTESREQFFNTLRQLDSSGQTLPASQNLDKDLSARITTTTRIPPVPTTTASPTMIKALTPTTTKATSSSSSSLSSAIISDKRVDNDKSITTATTAANSITTTKTSHPSPLSAHHQSSASPSSMDTLQSIKSPSASPPIAAGKGSHSVASPEETDESGYDQGDESVDSGGKSRSRLTSAAARKRQAQDSMSSASSTSSGGSPGHSVSRRSNGSATGHQTLNGQGPSKRPPLNTAVSGCQTSNTTTTTATSTSNTANLALKLIGQQKAGATTGAQTNGASDRSSQNQHLLGMIVGGKLGQPEDFEASLMRDVYSEITKLHAKFAVARSPAEDSMSNDSSNKEEEEEEEEEESTNSSGHFGQNQRRAEVLLANHSELGGKQDNEPMYSNLRVSRVPRAGYRVADSGDDDEVYDDEEDGDDDERHLSDLNRSKTYFQNSPARHQHQQHHKHHQQNDQISNQRHSNTPSSYVQNSSSSFDYLSLPRCGPMYPTMLNPIPECGELTPQQHSMPANHQRQTMSPNGAQQHGNFVVSASNEDNIRIRHSSKRNETIDSRKTNQRSSNNQRSQVPSLMRSKLPTNHYVINDVQYAKISRNVCSKYESCL